MSRFLPSFRKSAYERLLKKPDGQRLWGNAMGGVRAGIHGIADTAEFFETALTAGYAETTKDATGKSDTLKSILCAQRYDARANERVTVKGGEKLLPRHNSIDLSNETVYSVVSLEDFHRYLSGKDLERLSSLHLHRDGAVTDKDVFERAVKNLKPDDRTFALNENVGLGRFVLWFTNEACYKAALGQCNGSSSLPLVDVLRAYLGLGHIEAGTWLVLLKIPGKAIQNAGHYRPIFCDGRIGEACWLMVRSSRGAGFGNTDWGQACRLDALKPGAIDYDGAAERVAIQPRSEHFEGLKIGFDILGRCGDFDKTVALEMLSDGIWRRRRR